MSGLSTAFLEAEGYDPFRNLAVEEGLLARREDCFYLWRNDPSVILGRHQNTLQEVCLPALAEEGAALARRLTGGGAVYHDRGNLNFSHLFSCPRTGDFEQGCARARQEMTEFLAALGVSAFPTGRNDLCIRTEAGVRKISGAAMLQRGERGLYHATLLCGTDLARMERLLAPPPEKLAAKGVASVRGRVANLSQLRPEYTADALLDAWRERLSRRCPPAEPEGEEERRRREAREAFLRSDAWVRGRDPLCGIVRSARFPVGWVRAELEVKGGVLRRCAFSGDFLDALPMEELERGLAGVPYDRASLTRRLEELKAWRYFQTKNLLPILALMDIGG